MICCMGEGLTAALETESTNALKAESNWADAAVLGKSFEGLLQAMAATTAAIANKMGCLILEIIEHQIPDALALGRQTALERLRKAV